MNAETATSGARVLVWDVPVRVFHWLMVELLLEPLVQCTNWSPMPVLIPPCLKYLP